MIQLYRAIIQEIGAIENIAICDMDQGQKPKQFPSVFVDIKPIQWQSFADYKQGEIYLNIRAIFKPYLSSESKSPVLDSLEKELELIKEMKTCVENMFCDGIIQNMSIVGEGLKKDGELFVCRMEFKGLGFC
jgi:hypothetical protein